MKILIAEDDRYIGEGLRSLLESEGYATSLARDGEEALALFSQGAPDVVLLAGAEERQTEEDRP